MNRKEETIKRLLDEYLKGKSEEKRAAFLSKDIDRQYAAIMAWKYRNEKRAESKRKNSRMLTAAEVLRHMRSLPELIGMIEVMADSDFDAMYKALDEARWAVSNYHANRRAREIAMLEDQRDAIQRRIDALRNE